ncbi:ISH3 family transposase [Methanosalsum natronophilum]|uniref:ISH3 family transposase n=1 Tax=Methanosalsum natronophilum TaxID=768733 RepID=UPI0021687B77|nr:ISH3 family transposase [Methanosalsum natronophilum]MCS3924917.1 putative transposase [Methanosalsum natronophilum]
MSFLAFDSRTCDKVELRPKQCIDTVLKPLLDNIDIKINGSLSPNHLKKINLEELIHANQSILLQDIVGTLKPEKKYEFAIDFTNDPYYGKIDSSNEKYVIRSQAKKSTNSFYSYVSLSIINKNERYTLAVLPVEKDKTKVDYLTYFIGLIKTLNFKIRVLCLDREFYSVDVIRFLQNSKVSHIIPVVRKGKEIKQLLVGRKARSAEYVMKNAQKQKVHLDIVIDVKYLKGQRSKHGCENLGFVVYGVKWSPRKVSTVYRRRFAIESSYRMRNILFVEDWLRRKLKIQLKVECLR